MSGCGLKGGCPSLAIREGSDRRLGNSEHASMKMCKGVIGVLCPLDPALDDAELEGDGRIND